MGARVDDRLPRTLRPPVSFVSSMHEHCGMSVPPVISTGARGRSTLKSWRRHEAAEFALDQLCKSESRRHPALEHRYAPSHWQIRPAALGEGGLKGSCWQLLWRVCRPAAEGPSDLSVKALQATPLQLIPKCQARILSAQIGRCPGAGE